MKASPWLLVLSMLLMLGVLSVPAATPDLAGKTGWTAVMYGAAKDPQGDSQAGPLIRISLQMRFMVRSTSASMTAVR